MKKYLIVLLICLISGVVFAADFEITVERSSMEIIKGVPVEVSCKIKNCSGNSLLMAYESDGFPVAIKVYRIDGTEVEPCAKEYAKRFPFFEQIAPNWEKKFRFPLCISSVGD